MRRSRAGSWTATRRWSTSRALGENYKAEIIASIPAGEAISLYGQGDWIDLCRGPHVPSTGKLTAFKLMKVAGAYWRGDSQATRCCSGSTARRGPTSKQLEAYLQAPRGGREARPPPHRPRARPVPPPGRRPGPGVLASEGLGHLAGRRAVHARRLPRSRATRKCAARRCWTCRCGRSPATGTTTRTTCSSPSRRSAPTR